MSPFDIAKALLQTKESCYDTEELFNKDYVPFMINRIMSNSERTVLFAECMDKYRDMDKKLQYDFYMTGIPKSRSFQKMWSKKDSSTINNEELEYICSKFGCNIRHATELHKLIGSSAIQDELIKRGGKSNDRKT